MQRIAPFQALLVEGISGVGKSTLIDALLRHHLDSAPPRRIRSLVHLSQTHTYGPLASAEDAGTLTVADNRQHLQQIVSHLEWLHQAAQEHQEPRCFVLIDTLHLTHCVRPGVLGWRDVADFDRRLFTIGCKLLTLRADPEVIWQRGIVSRENTGFLLNYARKFGRTQREIHQHFMREQDTLIDLHAQSNMRKQLLQQDQPASEFLAQVYRLWTESSSSA